MSKSKVYYISIPLLDSSFKKIVLQLLDDKRKKNAHIGLETVHGKRRESLNEVVWCSMNSMPSRPIPMVWTRLPDKPWQIEAIDLCGPFPLGWNLLVTTDYYSRWVEGYLACKYKYFYCSHMFDEDSYTRAVISDNMTQISCKDSENGNLSLRT